MRAISQTGMIEDKQKGTGRIRHATAATSPTGRHMQAQQQNTSTIGTVNIAGTGSVSAMGTLLTGMNRDIRTSMNGLRGMLELLINTGLTPSQQQFARTAQHSMDNLLESLERIVDMSLIESNQFQLNLAPFDLLTETKTAWCHKHSDALSKGIDLSITYPKPILLHGDAPRLREAASGLVDIALQCADGGRVAAAMQATDASSGRCDVDLSVHVSRLSKTGEQLARTLNQPLPADSAVPQARSKESLAISLCARLVRLMGGTISVRQSETAAMFRISVELPLAANPLAGVRGLIIAANADEWKALMHPLEQHGVQIDAFDVAAPGLSALRSAEAGSPYRVVMLGRHVQGMDATILASAIKANPAHRDSLLALLDEQRSFDTTRMIQEGFAAFLCRSAPPSSIESTLFRLWTAAANGQSPRFLSTGTAVSSANGDDIPLSFSGCTILVADDNPVNQQVAARMLEKLGCKAELAVNGKEAVDMHATRLFDLILMDCDMPVLDGLQATRQIRETEAGRRTPIIALTACTGQGEQEQCIAAGMDDFLSKPIRPQSLKDMLGRWLAPNDVDAGVTSASVCSDELESVHEMFGTDFSELASLYQNDGPPRLTSIREAGASGDWARVAKVAHTVAGSSASIGATRLSALCKEMEGRAKSGSVEDFENRMSAIEAEYGRICSKLQSMLGT